MFSQLCIHRSLHIVAKAPDHVSSSTWGLGLLMKPAYLALLASQLRSLSAAASPHLMLQFCPIFLLFGD